MFQVHDMFVIYRHLICTTICDSNGKFHNVSTIVSCVPTLNLGLGVAEIQSLQEV